jgi:hypothetical protein
MQTIKCATVDTALTSFEEAVQAHRRNPPERTIFTKHVNCSKAFFRFSGFGCLSAGAGLHGEFQDSSCSSSRAEFYRRFPSLTQGMTAIYGDVDRDAQEKESLKTIATALELGINLLDTAWIYQVCVQFVINLLTTSAHAVFCAAPAQCPSADGSKIYYNEEIVGKAIKIHGREKFVVCTKFGMSATREVSALSSQIKHNHNQCSIINMLPPLFLSGLW